MATDTKTAARDVQGEIMRTIQQSQDAVLDALRDWTEAVHSLAPKLPPVNVPFAEKLPSPEELITGAYDFAEQLLANQRRFAVEVVRATTSLLPAKTEAGARNEPAGGVAAE